MDPATLHRLFGFQEALLHPVTLMTTLGIGLGLTLSGVGIPMAHRRQHISETLYRELVDRWKSWCWLVVLMIAPVLFGAAWTMAAVALLSLLCYREYARATGLFRERLLSACVVLGILIVTFAAVDHYDRLFFASAALGVALIIAVTIPLDRPHGFVQRTALAVVGFLLFGFSLGYLGLMANTGNLGNGADYRPLVLLILVAVELNDIFAYCCGKLIGGPKLLPNTSPGKTVAGSLGALVLTTLLVWGLGKFLFAETPMDRPDRLVTLGILISGLGQLGDLMLSSIKRDIGIKDTGAVIPGHGGLLDRFDSLVLVPPAVFHYLSLHLGPLGADQAARIITGGN